MKIVKKVVAEFGAPYSICTGSLMDERVVIAGSESIGGAFTLYSEAGNEAVQIVEGRGGIMAILILDSAPVPALLTAEGLHTKFISSDAGISVYRAEAGLHGPWSRRRIADFPFIHRIALVTANGRKTVLAATLCGEKKAIDDWSSPGAVYAVPIGNGSAASGSVKKVIIDGITKNHGLCVVKREGRETVCVSGEEGLFAIRVPQGAEEWKVEKIMDQPISEFFLYDLDDDGESEIAAVQPFHGDALCIYKRNGRGWVSVYETGIESGHGIWAGGIGGKNGIVLGSRAGKRDLCLYTVENPSRWNIHKTVIDKGTGTSQLDVRRDRERDVITATNNFLNEVAVYEIIP